MHNSSTDAGRSGDAEQLCESAPVPRGSEPPHLAQVFNPCCNTPTALPGKGGFRPFFPCLSAVLPLWASPQSTTSSLLNIINAVARHKDFKWHRCHTGKQLTKLKPSLVAAAGSAALPQGLDDTRLAQVGQLLIGIPPNPQLWRGNGVPRDDSLCFRSSHHRNICVRLYA